MSRVELMIATGTTSTIAIHAADVVAIGAPRADESDRAFDIDELLGLGSDSDASPRALAIAVTGGRLIALSRAAFVLTPADTSSCYGVPRILREAGCDSWLCGFVLDARATAPRVVPWINIVRLLETEYTRRLFFSP